jgi:probable F420-dependent oxidoreductase
VSHTPPSAGKLGLGAVGVALTVSDTYLDAAAEVEGLGYSALWLPGGQLDQLGRLADLIHATRAVRVAPAIISPDVYPAEKVIDFYARQDAAAPARLVVGLGGPQRPQSLQPLNEYLDRLDRAEQPVPAHRRLLAALGPRKLEIARDRSAGAIVVLVTPDYVGAARRVLGPQATLVVDQMLVADADASTARETARQPLRFLSGLPGYRASFARMGFTENEVTGLADRLVDNLVIWGNDDTITARVRQQLKAGADHVMLHALSDGSQPGPLEVARSLASGLTGRPS